MQKDIWEGEFEISGKKELPTQASLMIDGGVPSEHYLCSRLRIGVWTSTRTDHLWQYSRDSKAREAHMLRLTMLMWSRARNIHPRYAIVDNACLWSTSTNIGVNFHAILGAVDEKTYRCRGKEGYCASSSIDGIADYERKYTEKPCSEQHYLRNSRRRCSFSHPYSEESV